MSKEKMVRLKSLGGGGTCCDPLGIRFISGDEVVVPEPVARQAVALYPDTYQIVEERSAERARKGGDD